jgi:hypothetical protein
LGTVALRRPGAGWSSGLGPGSDRQSQLVERGPGRLFVCSARLGTALGAGDTVTATYCSFNGLSLISVNAISALASSGVVDATASEAGNDASPDSGAATTTSAAAVLFGAIAHRDTPTFSPGQGYTLVGAVSDGVGNDRRTLSPEYRLVSQTGSYAATGTLSSKQARQAAVIAYHAP